MTKEERYSILRPLTVEEQEVFAVKMCNFFAPWNYDKNCELLGIVDNPKTIRPFTFGDLLKYLKLNLTSICSI